MSSSVTTPPDSVPRKSSLKYAAQLSLSLFICRHATGTPYKVEIQIHEIATSQITVAADKGDAAGRLVHILRLGRAFLILQLVH